MIETGAMMGAEESGGFGSGCTCPSATASTPTCCCSTCSCASGGRALAGVAGDRALPRDRRAVVLPAHRRPRRARRVPGDKRRLLVDLAAAPPTELAGDRSPDRAARHRRRLQVLPGRRVVAARSGRPGRSRSSASTRRRLGGAARRAAGRRRSAGARR
jgi:hypothetical protein